MVRNLILTKKILKNHNDVTLLGSQTNMFFFLHADLQTRCCEDALSLILIAASVILILHISKRSLLTELDI